MVQPWQVTSLVQYGHCSYCGTAYASAVDWPRTCPGCGETTWRNPLPVAVLLVPVRFDDGGPDGMVVVRRDIEPGRGELCLPGGFIEFGESWQAAAVRELREEAGGLDGAPDDVALFDVISTPRHVMVFGILPPRPAALLPPSTPTNESTEWLVVREHVPLVFPSHDAALRRYFASA